MRKISEKLNSGRGTTLLIALLFFLTCLVAASATLTAATSSAVKEKDRYTQQQAYLAVSSAARLLKAELGTYRYVTGSQLEQEPVYDTDGTTVAGYRDVWTAITPYVTPEDTEGGDLLTDAYSVCGGVSDRESAFTISAEGMPDVQAEFQMQADGGAVFLLSTAGAAYSVRLSFTARTSETRQLTRDLYTTSWDAGVIAKEAA